MRIATMTYGTKLLKYNATKIAQITEGAARYKLPGMYAQQSKKDAKTVNGKATMKWNATIIEEGIIWNL